ncbi:MAG: hypothetical protein R3C14_40495 [Caldilineaceae bacterium]
MFTKIALALVALYAAFSVAANQWIPAEITFTPGTTLEQADQLLQDVPAENILYTTDTTLARHPTTFTLPTPHDQTVTEQLWKGTVSFHQSSQLPTTFNEWHLAGATPIPGDLQPNYDPALDNCWTRHNCPPITLTSATVYGAPADIDDSPIIQHIFRPPTALVLFTYAQDFFLHPG